MLKSPGSYRIRGITFLFWATDSFGEGGCLWGKTDRRDSSQAEMPDLQKLSEDYADSLVVLGVNVGGDSPEDAAAFMEENGYTYPLYVDADYMLSTFIFPTQAIPLTVVIDPNGVATAIHMGLGTYEQFQEYVDAALANVPAEAETEPAEEAA